LDIEIPEKYLQKDTMDIIRKQRDGGLFDHVVVGGRVLLAAKRQANELNCRHLIGDQ
jgi:hypothetical protein